MKAFAHGIVETVRHPLLVLDGALRVVDANAAFYRTFGSNASAIVGKDFFEIDGRQWDQPRVRLLLKEVIPRYGSFKDEEIEYDCPHLGRRVMVLDGHRVARDDDSTPMILLAMEDDTERRRVRNELGRLNRELERRAVDRTAELVAANQALLDSNRELGSANRELEAFCYSVSHDLRSPLRAIDGFSQELLLRHADQLDEKGRHYLARVRAGTQRMGQLIDDLLKLSRVTRNEMQRVPVDLTALAETVAAELREREPGRAVTFSAQPGLTAEGDPALCRVVLENLLGNAWKFTAKHPTATITFEQAEAPSAPFSPLIGGKMPKAFVVRDDGAGFDMAFAAKMFGAFQRLHSDREFPGTGIGLATVQRIIRRHGGEVWAQGAVGCGAAFFFTLPGTEVHP
jgi:PAS domain S-box-containing protein